MAAVEVARAYTRRHPRRVTGVLSAIGYAVVIGAFAGALPVPEIGVATVELLSDLIAIVNTAALLLLLVGWRFIRRREIGKHRAAMLSAFLLILVFLVLYVWKVSGGFEKSFVGPPVITRVYLGMLAVHILLSVISVPVVIHALVLGLTHHPNELAETVHPRVGRIAVGAWTLSLFLGIVTYLLLNHVYAWERIGEAVLVLGLVVPVPDRT